MSELVKLHYDVDGNDFSAAGEASIEINMVIHADGGTADVSVGLDEIDITLADKGPGIPDVEKAMQKGWSTASEEVRSAGFGAGMGLPNMKKNTDEMEIETEVGVGTTIHMKVYVA